MQMSFCWLWRLFDFSLISASFNFYQLFKELHQNLSGAQLLIHQDPAALFICRCCDGPYRFSNKPYEPQKCYMFHSVWNPKLIIFPSFISRVTASDLFWPGSALVTAAGKLIQVRWPNSITKTHESMLFCIHLQNLSCVLFSLFHVFHRSEWEAHSSLSIYYSQSSVWNKSKQRCSCKYNKYNICVSLWGVHTDDVQFSSTQVFNLCFYNKHYLIFIIMNYLLLFIILFYVILILFYFNIINIILFLYFLISYFLHFYILIIIFNNLLFRLIYRIRFSWYCIYCIIFVTYFLLLFLYYFYT